MRTEGPLNSVLVDYVSQNNLGELLRLAKKPCLAEEA